MPLQEDTSAVGDVPNTNGTIMTGGRELLLLPIGTPRNQKYMVGVPAQRQEVRPAGRVPDID